MAVQGSLGGGRIQALNHMDLYGQANGQVMTGPISLLFDAHFPGKLFGALGNCAYVDVM